MRGDVTDAEAVRGVLTAREALAGRDAVAGQNVTTGRDGAVGVRLSRAGEARWAVVHAAAGLDADLTGADGRPVMDDPALLPPEHLSAGPARLRAAGEMVDWAVLTPGGELREGAARGRYVIGGDHVPDGAPGLTYGDLAAAVVDEVTAPTVRGRRGAVWADGV
ncbi:flavin reductase [Streptomyces roseirectus]|uniref:Flavin reductase n=1 Tax=Streptomyces roseirectus TaxID=2768066 RepID=A0A7H0IKL5_9ACTN|nr:flavin reductase [Streptomyces roseirectus]QNP73331.1 flavin reductase [Streptomyces roseirectus]